MSKRILRTLAVIGTLLLAAAAAAQDAPTDIGKLYVSKCASCHAPDGSGDTAMGKKLGVRSMASEEVQKMSDRELIAVTTKGKDKMPAYEKKLTADQIKELVAYMRGLGKNPK